MSDFAPADVVRRQYLASEVEWTEMAGFPLAGTYRTPEGVTANVMEKPAAEWESWTAHDDTYVVDGENVDVRVAHHFTVRGGAIVRFEQFTDTALVLTAVTA